MASALAAMSPRYDAVVVGSGYGGGVAACRLARSGMRVCVLERGRELQPGEFPDGPIEAAREMQANVGNRRIGRASALFDFHVGNDISVLVGCGLGGTSLINANVALEADRRVFDDPRWPQALRGGDDELLREGFVEARRMLGSTVVPSSMLLAKAQALRTSADALQPGSYRPLEVNVTFEAGENAAGVHQAACTGCGDCVSGCNTGAKNSTLMNYVADAHRHGAAIFTEVRVETVTPAPAPDGGWLVSFTPTGTGRKRFDAPQPFVLADVVVLAAGTLGSTAILLRSRRAGLPVSERLGDAFTGNGDVLGFAYDADVPVRGIGWGRSRRAQPVGPCITSVIDLRDTENVDHGLIVEEGVLPGAIGRLYPAAMAVAATVGGTRPLPRRLLAAALGPRAGAMRRTQTYLVMTTDDGKGCIELDGDGVQVRWPGVGDRPVFRRVNDTLARAARAIGGEYVVDPVWTKALRRSLMTVHPLGGCVMADEAEHGVVDDRGRVFAGETGSDVHDGLYVADGAVVPRPLGVNPLLTITALAERACALLLRDRAATRETKDAPPNDAPATPGLRFTERMAGWMSTSVLDDFRAAASDGRAEGTPCEFVLTVEADDADRFLAEAGHHARLSGTVVAPALAPRRLVVSDGRFTLFEPWPDEVDTWRMWYRMRLHADDGRTWRFEGYKIVHDTTGLDVWSDTSTLYTTITTDDDTGEVVACGILRIRPLDFAKQLTTFRAVRASRRQAVRNLARFGKLFAGQLVKVYGGPLDPAAAFGPDPRLRPPMRALDLPRPETSWCHADRRWDDRAGDDAWLRLTRYGVGSKGPVLLAPGFGMSTAAFVTDTVKPNVAEYLVARGYDVWLFDYRASTDLPSARSSFTIDDVAQVDWPEAVDEVRRRTGAESVQVVAHCVGSMSLLMAALAGMDGVRSAVCSQVTVHPVPPLLNKVKTYVRLGRILQGLGLRTIEPDLERNGRDMVLDTFLRMVPVPKGERCTSAVCRWIFSFYGPTHHHAQLDRATHADMGRLFGVADLRALDHVARVVREGRAVADDGADIYLPHVDRLAFPILFLAGSHNRIFLPDTSERTYEWLRAHNDPALYERHVFADYAHLDGFIGKRAADDVYPVILEHLDRWNVPPTVPLDLTEPAATPPVPRPA